METNVIMVDRISNVAVSNGIVRIECVSVSAAGEEKPSGTVLIPGIVAGQVISVPGQCHAGPGQEAAGRGRRRRTPRKAVVEGVCGVGIA